MADDFDDEIEFDNDFDVDTDIVNNMDIIDSAEIDDQTQDMFGETAPKKDWLNVPKSENTTPYLVLARKYRPQNFDDLIGQEAMVKTLTNAFKQNRIAHAFMLTGVRGIGKTTTARLIARALNYSSPGNDAPNMNLNIDGIHCDAITQGRHPDVIELDAASNTGVDKMRDILENVRYGPTQARFKVYIIDEVHMLSTAAFNALLKTLEEPPPHAKFIFATTETHKVPVTILSRCQRFDLRRLEREVLANHLDNICKKENVTVEREGLLQIARAAEGSVRDALSLLDQAIVQETQSNAVTSDQVRIMLGLSDRNRVYVLFECIIAGDAKGAIIEAREQYDYGASPNNILSSLMEIAHEISKYLVLGDDYKLIEAQDASAQLGIIASKTSKLQISRLWQMLLTGFEEAKRAPDAMQALEMCLIRLCGAAKMPSPEDLARLALSGGFNNNIPATEGANSSNSEQTTARKTQFDSFEDMLKTLEEAAGERALVSHLERYARPVRLEKNLFAYEPTDDAPRGLNLKLVAALKNLTGEDWRVYIEENGGQTIDEIRKAAEAERMAILKQDPKIKNVLKLFPGAKIAYVRAPENVKNASSN